MFEKYLFKAEDKANFFLIFLQVLIAIIALATVNFFMGGNSIFLVALVALTFAYPVTKYMRKRIGEELHNKIDETQLLLRHDIELIVFWSIFIASTVGFFLATPLVKDFSAQANFFSSISGYLTNEGLSFASILANNLGVLALTFILSFISVAGLLLVVVWNASILSYVLKFAVTDQPTIIRALGYLSHGLIEIAGFVLAGISAVILAYKFEHLKHEKHKSVLLKDSILLLLIGIMFIVFAAFIETI